MNISTLIVASAISVCIANLAYNAKAFSDNLSPVERAVRNSQMGQNLMNGTPTASPFQQMSQPGAANTFQRMSQQAARNTTAARVQSYNAGDANAAVRQLFERYKSFDLSNNTQIMSLYAPDAQIDVMGTKYNKASYSRYVATAYNNPASGANTHTRYGEPNIRVSSDSAQVSFAGSLGQASMNVYWNLRRNAHGVWQIASEQFTVR